MRSAGGSQVCNRDDQAAAGAPGYLPFIRSKEPATSTENNPFAAIVALSAFERFVFVMSVVLLISWHILVQIIWHTRSFLAVPADPGSV